VTNSTKIQGNLLSILINFVMKKVEMKGGQFRVGLLRNAYQPFSKSQQVNGCFVALFRHPSKQGKGLLRVDSDSSQPPKNLMSYLRKHMGTVGGLAIEIPGRLWL